MQRLDLNLASNPFRNNTLLWIGYTTAAVLLLTFSVWNVQAFREHRRLLGELRSEVGTFESQRRELETRATRAQNGIEKCDIDSLRKRSEKANEVIEWKAFSWTHLFNSMETVQPEQVRMNAIRPLFRSSQRGDSRGGAEKTAGMPVAIEGTARTFGDFAEMEHALQDSEQFRRVWPERANRIDNGEILFQLSFLFAGAEGSAAEAEAADSGEEEEAELDEAAAGADRAEDGPTSTGQPTASETSTDVRDAWPPTESTSEKRGGGTP